MVEHTTHNRAVAGSIPASATTIPAHIERSGLVPAGARVLVALSGGPDSTALMLALRTLERDVVAAHFDHALRDSSAQDAAFVTELCERHNVALITERRQAPLDKGSPQAAARKARYEFLFKAQAAAGADVIAVAHTSDDQVETILINLLRGTGIAGLRGIPASRPPIVRPLLSATRAGVIAYLDDTGEHALDDPSNSDPRYLRVRVRQHLLPHLEAADPQIRSRLLRLASAANSAAAQLGPKGEPDPERCTLLSASPAVRAGALRAMYSAVAGTAPGLARVHLEALERLTSRWATGASLDLPRGVRFRLLPDRVTFDRREAPQAPAYRLRSRPCPGCADPHAAHLRPGHFTLGVRRAGLRMRPAGARGSRKLQDILVDAKVPRHEREMVPLVFRNGELAWVPAIAVDVTHTTDQARPGLHVELERVLPAVHNCGGTRSDRW